MALQAVLRPDQDSLLSTNTNTDTKSQFETNTGTKSNLTPTLVSNITVLLLPDDAFGRWNLILFVCFPPFLTEARFQGPLGVEHVLIQTQHVEKYLFRFHLPCVAQGVCRTRQARPASRCGAAAVIKHMFK
jgi:hypothetical protein